MQQNDGISGMLGGPPGGEVEEREGATSSQNFVECASGWADLQKSKESDNDSSWTLLQC